MADTLASLVEAHRADSKRIADTLARSYTAIHAYDDPALFLALRDEQWALSRARELAEQGPCDRALYGVPCAVKDNIDVEGLPTTAGCPAFAYLPKAHAAVVARLERAGAIIIGKTNLDQFATGLVGVRSPSGTPRNPFRPELIPGGSSSGSAIAVSAGLVPFALGTDTAGSGRIPAGLTNIVGLKPSLGLVPNSGVVPACRSLDCVSIFALTAEDAFRVLETIAGPDRRDAFSREMPLGCLGQVPPVLRIGVPAVVDRIFFGDRRAEAAFETALDLLRQLGAKLIPIQFAPFFETAKLLYEGAFVAERSAAVGSFIAAHPQHVFPITRQIIEAGANLGAVDAFRDLYRIRELRSHTQDVFRGIDVMVVPTAPAAYTIAEVKADPIGLNARLGTYTNFANLLDLAALAVPATIAADHTPFGVTFLAPAGGDDFLASFARVFHARTGLSLGATGKAHPPLATTRADVRSGEIALAVVGAHLSGMPLNGELRAFGARFLEATRTRADYRLFALGGLPPKPGLLRTEPGMGVSIAVELWALVARSFGEFVAKVPPPLGIGTLQLCDGRFVKGFVVEAIAVGGAPDISHFGGWRAYVDSVRTPA